MKTNYESIVSLMKQRQSIRDFSEPASKDQLEKIIEAGISAPSAFNSQPWKFVSIETPEKKRQIREYYSALRRKNNWYEQDTSFVERASIVLVLCEEKTELNLISCSLAIQNMLLASESMDLGSLCVGAFQMNSHDEKEFLKICGVEKGKLVLVCLFGKKNESPERKPRKPLEEVFERK